LTSFSAFLEACFSAFEDFTKRISDNDSLAIPWKFAKESCLVRPIF